MATAVQVQDHPAHSRYEAQLDGQLAGFAEYNLLNESILFSHTEVLPGHEGQGIGSALARHALDDARARGLHVVPACTFFAGYIRKHPQYADLVRADVKKAFKI